MIFLLIGPRQITSCLSKGKRIQVSEKKLRLLTINFQSINAKKEFWSLVEECHPDIVQASETWLHTGTGESGVLPANYRFVARKDRKGNGLSAHGGVAIYCKNQYGRHRD